MHISNVSNSLCYLLNNIQIRVPTKIPTAEAINIGTTN